MNANVKINWRWGAIAATAMVVLALYPQLYFWITEGNWESGAYAHVEGVGDEVAYSAYVNALIDGRPRRNDPYTGHDDLPGQPQPESLFSIQFVPAYMIALPCRALGLTASSAFIALMLAAAVAASLAVFWLLASVTVDSRLAAVGTIVVLCLGTLVGGHGHVVSLFGFKPLYNYLTFLRRYQPSATFPFFFVLCALTWRTLAREGKGTESLLSALGVGPTFGLLIFSYFYLWTAAAAWLACIALLWMWMRPDGWRRDIKLFGVSAAVAIIAFVPYAILLKHRAQTMDAVQALATSHAPDLLRLPELLSAAVLLALGYGARRGVVSLRDKRLLFSASFALMPFAVFNQQVITGRSLQPIHYEIFIANYSALVACVMATAIVCRGHKGTERIFPKRVLAWIAIAAFEWGAYEAHVAATGSREFNRQLADAQPVAVRLAQIAQDNVGNAPRSTVLSTNLFVADCLPESAPQSALWAPHMLVFSGATMMESKERLFQQLYYTGVKADGFERFFDDGNYYGVAVGLFGFDRVIDGLSENRVPITRKDIDAEARLYADYVASFNQERAAHPALSYVVAPAGGEPDLTNLDRWYERDAGERVGKFILYRVRLRGSDR